MDPDQLREKLAAAGAGLRWTSETDSDLVPFVWPEAPGDPTPEAVRSRGGHAADSPVGIRSLADFFRAVPKADRPRFAKLGESLAELLGSMEVVTVGRVRMTAYIVGRAPAGGWAGLFMDLVET